MSEIRLAAEVRTQFGKGGARRTRRAGKIPAVIYGHGAHPLHVSLPAHEFGMVLKKNGANVLLTVTVDGKDELTIPKAIQRHPIKGVYEHVDLISVRKGEKITIEVPLRLTGEIAPGGLLAQEYNSVSVEAEATHLPTEIDISVEGLEVGAHFIAGDLVMPAGATLVTDPETLLVHISEAPSEADMAAQGEGDASELVAVEEPATPEVTPV